MSLVQWIKKTLTNAGHQKELNDSKIKQNNNKKFDPNEPTPELTSDQLELLKDTWQRVQRDVASVGVITFVRFVTFYILRFHLEISEYDLIYRNVSWHLSTESFFIYLDVSK